MTDKRRHSRDLANYRVRLFHESFGDITTTIRDMSSGGFCVNIDASTMPVIGDHIMMQLLDTEQPGESQELEVVWRSNGAIGLKFLP